MNGRNFSVLKEQTLKSIKVDQHKEFILFETTEGHLYKMSHNQDCCECIMINDICGDIQDLISSKILLAEESSNSPDDYTTWTFYKLSTMKGSVTITWKGTSNGYYSQSVDFVKLQN